MTDSASVVSFTCHIPTNASLLVITLIVAVAIGFSIAATERGKALER